DAKELGAIAGGHGGRGALGATLAHAFEPRRTLIDDRANDRQGLDVIDDGGSAECPGDGGERRLDAGPAALAFERFEQTGLFAADVCPRAAVDDALGVAAVELTQLRPRAKDLIC